MNHCLLSSLACSIRIPQNKIPRKHALFLGVWITWDHCFTSNMNHELSTGSKGTIVYTVVRICFEKGKVFSHCYGPYIQLFVMRYVITWWISLRHQKSNDLLGQWPNFKLFGITCLVGKIKFELLFQGPLAKWGKPQNLFELMVEFFFWVWRLEPNLQV